MEEEIFLYSETIKQFFDEESGELKYSFYLYKCPVCGKQGSKNYLTHYNFDYSKCKNCGFVYANPRLNNEGSKIWYNSDFYNAALEAERFLVKQGDPYYSSSLSLDKMKCIAECLLKNSEKDSRILDFGCGIGSFLHLLKEEYRFTNLKGIDLNESAVKFAKEYRNLDVLLGDAKEFAGNHRFDIVLSIETIEHMNDLNAYANTIRNLLKPGGLCIISTPYNDPKARWIGGVFGDHYMAPNHINFFNRETISSFLSRYGLNPIEFKFWNSTIGIGTMKRRIFYKRDWATATPPTLVNHGVTYPKSYNGEIRHFVKELLDYNQLNNKKGIGMLNPAKPLKQLINKVLSVKIRYHMLVVAKKE